MLFRLLFTFLFVLFNLISSSQEITTSSQDWYFSAGVSISNSSDSTFAYSSYPSIEFGFSKNNLALGVVLGRSNFVEIKRNQAESFFYELKSALTFPVQKKLSAYGLMGIGNYLSTSRIFIEYGIGAVYTFGKSSIFTQVSNWDGTTYITPGWSFTF